MMGLLGGWWTDFEPLTSLPIMTPARPASAEPVHRWAALLEHSLELLRSIWRWLLLGVVVSAAIATLLPAGALSSLAGGGGFVAMLVTLVIALPLYVCATASVPIAAALVASGLPVGAALVFLMAGPATNVATIGAVYRTLGRRALAIYLSTVICGSMLCGWLFGFLIAGETAATNHVHAAPAWWSIASAVILLGLICRFAVQDLSRSVLQSVRKNLQFLEAVAQFFLASLEIGLDRTGRGFGRVFSHCTRSFLAPLQTVSALKPDERCAKHDAALDSPTPALSNPSTH